MVPSNILAMFGVSPLKNIRGIIAIRWAVTFGHAQSEPFKVALRHISKKYFLRVSIK